MIAIASVIILFGGLSLLGVNSSTEDKQFPFVSDVSFAFAFIQYEQRIAIVKATSLTSGQCRLLWNYLHLERQKSKENFTFTFVIAECKQSPSIKRGVCKPHQLPPDFCLLAESLPSSVGLLGSNGFHERSLGSELTGKGATGGCCAAAGTAGECLRRTTAP